MDVKEVKSKFKSFLDGRGFYFVLAACLVATGVAAWTAYAAINGDKNDNTASSEPTPSIHETQNEPVEKEPYEAPESSEPVEEEPISPPTVATNFVYPLSGTVLQKFSDTELVFSETFEDMRLHLGLDVTGEDGATVSACGNGVVTSIGEDALLGFTVEIDHGNGVTAKYCGLKDTVLVRVGDIVSAGSSLGYIGEIPSECKLTPHLHLEFLKDGYAIDPEEFLRR